jgi:glyoxylate carboligase
MMPWIFRRRSGSCARVGRAVLIDLPPDVQKGEIVYDPEADSR